MKALLPRFVLTWVLFLAAYSLLSGQSLAETAPDGRLRPYLAWSPPKVTDPVNRGLLGAVGVVWPAGWSVEVGYLWLFPYDKEPIQVRDHRGGRLHLTARRYFVQRPETPLVPFVQLRGDLLRRTHRTVATFQREGSTVGSFDTYEDSVGVATRTRTLNLMFGVDWAITGHFSIEFSGGIGSRFRRVTYFDRINEEDEAFDNYLEEIFDTRNGAGEGSTINVPLDLRLIYRW